MTEAKDNTRPERSGEVSRPAWRRRVTLNTAFAQRVYKRVFDRLKADIFVLTVRTRAMGYEDAAAAAEKFLKEQFAKVREDLATEIERADVLMDSCGVDAMPAYGDAQPIEAEFTTPFAGQFLGLVESMDQLLMRMDALWLTSAIETRQRTMRSYEWQRRLIKLAGRVRHLGDQTRLALRKPQDQKDAPAEDTATSDEASPVPAASVVS